MVVGVSTAHADELIPRDTQLLWVTTHVLAKQALVKVVVTGRYWCVYGVKTASTYQLQSLVKCQSLVDVVAQALQVTQGSVSLVTVVDILLKFR